jgi:predicted  nucleic acid-binding Zn-ribbon protein
MTEEIEQVTRLQSLDLRIGELEREVATLPKHIAQIEKALDQHLRRLEADRAALAGNQKERKSLEDDSKVESQKISKLKDQMLGARPTNNIEPSSMKSRFARTPSANQRTGFWISWPKPSRWMPM